MSERLDQCLQALGRLLERPEFGAGAPTLGAELELFLVDDAGRPLPRNAEVQAAACDERFTPELGRYNLECNLSPVAVPGPCFSALGGQLRDALATVRHAAAQVDTRVALIGILPTLRRDDLGPAAISDVPRYWTLDRRLRALRGEPYRIHINGADPLMIDCDDISPETANTSLQLHLRVPPADFARIYNAAQIATAPALAVAGNSPTFLEHRLWEETRIVLFKQAVDQRGRAVRRLRAPRVGFGTGWVRRSALELFVEGVRRYEPLIPVTSDEHPLERVAAGDVPLLEELRLHQGTVWLWNRPVYDAFTDPHLRIEFRALPAGPTVTDMLANVAFLLGVTLALAADAEWWTDALPFDRAHDNFYRAAQSGLDAVLTWPAPDAGLTRVTSCELIPRLLPVARRGLAAAGIDGAESAELLQVIAGRVAARQTGAVWQRHTLADLEPRLGRRQALMAMLRRYLKHAHTDRPVHTWPV